VLAGLDESRIDDAIEGRADLTIVEIDALLRAPGIQCSVLGVEDCDMAVEDLDLRVLRLDHLHCRACRLNIG